MKISPVPFRDPLVDKSGQVTRAWQEWLNELQRALAAMPTIQTFGADPNAAVTGAIGDLVTTTTGGANLTLWVKESAPTTSTGWVAK